MHSRTNEPDPLRPSTPFQYPYTVGPGEVQEEIRKLERFGQPRYPDSGRIKYPRAKPTKKRVVRGLLDFGRRAGLDHPREFALSCGHLSAATSVSRQTLN